VDFATVSLASSVGMFEAAKLRSPLRFIPPMLPASAAAVVFGGHLSAQAAFSA